ncbi:MAG: SLC13 family permease [Pseudomonadota bacterium]
MTPEIILVLTILGVSVVLLVTEWIPMEATALLVLGTVALTGLATPIEALSGFSNPAVVTVWAVFILSAGLQRTGVANIIGRQILRMAGRSEARIITVIMLAAGLMSAFMNNVAVAALLLPVTMDIARKTGTPPSRLLMPLAFGSLLGGLTTMIGTPPNILVSSALREAGLPHFRLFDFTPVGLAVMAAGVAFTATIGRRLLPMRDVARESEADRPGLRARYELQDRTFVLRVRPDSALAGRTLAQSRLGSMLGLYVVEIIRKGRTVLSPGPAETLKADDRLVVQGRIEQLDELGGWRELAVEEQTASIEGLTAGDGALAQALVSGSSALEGKTLRQVEFQARYGLSVLAMLREKTVRRTGLQDEPLQAGDRLLIHGPSEKVKALGRAAGDLGRVQSVGPDELTGAYRMHERLMKMRVPPGCALAGRTLKKSRLGDALDMRVLAIHRDGVSRVVVDAGERLEAGDLLLVIARAEDLDLVRAMEGLEVEREAAREPDRMESERVGLMEAILSPHTTLAGKTLRQIRFREKYGLSVLALWRRGRPARSNLAGLPLRFGDALLLYGPREKLALLGREHDFVVLTEAAQPRPAKEKAWISTLIMAAVLLPVLLGVVPIYIAAVVGAAFMVVTRCLTMEEAYRAIEWKAVFLIAGMLPLGLALDQTGAAGLAAHGVVTALQPMGAMAVMLGLLLVTFMATSIIPTSALVVLMSPIILSTAADMGLSPHALMMALAMAASSSFTSPVAHPANLMVMGPGGYRFTDYLKLGVPLTLVVLVVIVLCVPLFWPLTL